MNLCYSKGTKNWGDDCNPFIFKFITGQEPNFISMNSDKKFHHYMMVGSILHYCNEYTEIWGIVLRFKNKTIKKPKKIHAVRGPITRDILLNKEIDCPEVYGDPVLLLKKFYNPTIKKKYTLGVIPHYVDKKTIGKINEKKVLLIDIQKDFYTVIHDVLSCEKIVSSSLHGLILSDAYNIPCMWLKISDKVEGADIKFNDYFLSVERQTNKYIEYKSISNFLQCLKSFYRYKLNFDKEKLYKSCPFRKE